MVFFPFYAAAGIPSNIIIQRIGPSRWLCIITLATGLCTFVLSFTFSQLIDARFLGMTLMSRVKTSDVNGSAPSRQAEPIFQPAKPVNWLQAITSLALRLAGSERL